LSLIRNRVRITKTSKDAPGWFGVPHKPPTKIAYPSNGTLTYLSKIHGWITVTPRSKNRRKAIENTRNVRIQILGIEWRCNKNIVIST